MTDAYAASAEAEDVSLPQDALTEGVPPYEAPIQAGVGGDLRRRTITGSFWTLVGYGSNMAMRIVSSAILTRLLLPEVYGIMQFVLVFITGLGMFSDVGIGPSIIQNERGDDEDFLNTAWTLQVIRGFALLLATFPLSLVVAWIYHLPALHVFLPMAGITALIQGFLSTRYYVCSRHLRVARLTIIEISTRAFTIILTVVLAYRYHNVWALIIGSLIGEVMKTALSHIALPGKRNRLAWDPAALRSLIHFGRWITLSTALFFVTRYSDRLLLGRFLTLENFAIYNMAVQLAETAEFLVFEIVQKVLYPAFSKVARHEPDRLSEVFYRSRLHLDAVFITGTATLAMMGPWLVHQIYGQLYWPAGGILQILCIRVGFFCVLNPLESCLVALGHTKFSFIRNTARAGAILVGVPIGWYLHKEQGIYWAVALSEVPPAIVLYWKFSQHKLTRPTRELLVFVFAALGIGIGLLLVHLLPPQLVHDALNWVRVAILHKPPKTL